VPAATLPDPPLSDGVVVLRPDTSVDVPARVAICQDPEISRWIAGCVHVARLRT